MPTERVVNYIEAELGHELLRTYRLWPQLTHEEGTAAFDWLDAWFKAKSAHPPEPESADSPPSSSSTP